MSAEETDSRELDAQQTADRREDASVPGDDAAARRDDASARDPWTLLDAARTVLLVHAHPDDEALATGGLIRSLADAGVRVLLVTATRGEAGEVVPGAIPPEDGRELAEVRAEEMARAQQALGVAERWMLGEAPALAEGQHPRRHRDSGMTWVREGLAGPSPDAPADAFSLRPLAEPVADLAAALRTARPDVVIGYDDEGTYGHPDHVRAHEVVACACDLTGIPLLELASTPDGEDPRFDWRIHDGAGVLDAVEEALRGYRTQLTVLGRAPREDDGAPALRIRHVGGQLQVVPLRTGLRLRGAAAP